MLKNILKRDKRRQTLSLDELRIMACPSCRFPVVFPKVAKKVRCPVCGRTFEIPPHEGEGGEGEGVGE